jgi:hypothetical protein
MKKIIFVICILFTSLIFSQELLMDTELVSSPDVINPKFNGGELDKFYEFLNKEFDFSKVTKAGKMITAFTIDETGEIKNIKVVQFVDVESATEIIRVLKKAPKWEPAIKGGKPFSVEIKFPLEFTLSKKEVSNNKSISSEINVEKENVVESNSQNNDKIPGGVSAFYKIIKENFKTPDVPGLKGKIFVSFTINEDGKLSDYKILKDLGYGTGQELIRVIELTSGKWTPAVKEGKPVKTTFTLPLSINVPND